MRKEQDDIVYDLGPKNWLDIVAGEAVLLGQVSHDVELVAAGTALAGELKEARFHREDFFKIEAIATNLGRLLEEKKTKQGLVLFLDEVCEFSGGNKALNKWEYDLILTEGRYQINMIMPEYYGQKPPDDGAVQIGETIRDSYVDFDELEKVEDSKMIGTQRMDTTDYYTNGGKHVFHQINFDHECGWKRGVIMVYYFDDYSQVLESWKKIKSILGQKK